MELLCNAILAAGIGCAGYYICSSDNNQDEEQKQKQLNEQIENSQKITKVSFYECPFKFVNKIKHAYLVLQTEAFQQIKIEISKSKLYKKQIKLKVNLLSNICKDHKLIEEQQIPQNLIFTIMNIRKVAENYVKDAKYRLFNNNCYHFASQIARTLQCQNVWDSVNKQFDNYFINQTIKSLLQYIPFI